MVEQETEEAGSKENEIDELRAGLKNGRMRKYIAKTDEAGTGLFRTGDNGKRDITVGKTPVPVDSL